MYYFFILWISYIVFADDINEEVSKEICVEDRKEAARESDCALYLAPSSLPGAGLGVFAGKYIEKYSYFTRGYAIMVNQSLAENWMMGKYSYEALVEGYLIADLGVAMLPNHNEESNVWHLTEERSQTEEDKKQKDFSFSIYRRNLEHGASTSLRAKSDIYPGQEIFASYGGEVWFKERNITSIASESVVMNDLKSIKEKGICLSDYEVGESLIPHAGLGVFAVKRYGEDDLISVAPLLPLPKDEVFAASSNEENCVLMNYCFTSERSNLALLPVTAFGLLNHGGEGGANVKVDWHHWNDKDHETLVKTVDELLGGDSINLFFAYRATRAIEAGEELLLDYGRKWDQLWRNYSSLEGEKEREHLLFRAPVEAPDNLFPSAWNG